VFRTVNGIEEAFRPGTERRREEERAPAQEIPTGPQNYNEVVRREKEEATGQPPSTAPAPPTTPPPPKKEPAEDLSGLY
jgi:penicillin-binding protein 1A